jgi:hypothetical protein
LIAFFGALVGVYLAFVKTKKEKLWQERYETLKAIVSSSDALDTFFSASHMKEMGVSVNLDREQDQQNNDLSEEKRLLRRNIASLQLLFKRKQIEKVLQAYVNVNSSLQDLLNSNPEDNLADHIKSVSDQAASLSRAAVELAQKI